MPLFTAAVAAFSAISTFIGGLGTVGAFVLKTAVGVGLNLLAQAIAGKPQKPKFSINGTLQRGGDLSRTFIIGKTATAGSLVYANTWGRPNKTPNEYLTQVVALSDYPVNGLAELWVNGEKVTLGDLDGDGMGYRVIQYQTDGGGDNHMWVKFYDGTQIAADTFLTGSVSSADRPWESSRIGSGVAYAIVTAQITDNLYSGIPSFKFVINGAKLYDITKDSTVAGGSGPHRWGDYSTYGGDGDHLPAVQAYNILRGITWNGKWFYGLQNMSGTRLPAANWISQINKCRATIAGASGLEPTYRSGGEIDIESPISDAVEACLTACQGRVSETGGIYKIHVGAPDAPVASITDGDIHSTEEQAFTPFFGLSDTINGITATYPSPEENWAAKVAPPLYSTAFEAEDGNRRLMADVPLDFVPYAEQVQRLMKSALEEARRARRHTFVLPPEYWVLEPGDVISFSSVRNGYENKLFRVDGVSDKANLDVMVDITEVDPADYDWDSGTDFHPPVDGAVGPMRPAPQPIIDWNAEPDVVRDNNGNPRRPAILLSWDGEQPDVIGVEFEVRLASSLVTVYQGRTDQPKKGSVLISQGLLPNTQYGVRGRYIAGSDRETLWSGWLPVLTLNILLGSDDVYIDDIVDEVNEQIGEHLEWAGNTTRWLTEQIERLNSLTAETGAQSATDKFELLAAVGNVTASYTRDILVVATGLEAAVSRVETLEVELDGVPGQIAAVSTAVDALTVTVSNQGGLITANADAITNVNATVGNFSAGGLFRAEVVATEVGALSTIGLYAVADDGDTTGQAALFLSAKTGGISTINLIADRLVISNPGETAAFPFIFQSGVLTMNATRVNTITAGMLRSSDSKMQIDLTNRRILIAD